MYRIITIVFIIFYHIYAAYLQLESNSVITSREELKSLRPYKRVSL
jgi:hypothetical protein